jgi:hypothetical protein
MGFLTALLVFGTALVAGLVGERFEKRRGARSAGSAVEAEAERIAFAAYHRSAAVVLAIAGSIVEQAEFDAALDHLDALAGLHPMPKRPAPQPLAPGDPWQLKRKNDTLSPRQAEGGEIDD